MFISWRKESFLRSGPFCSGRPSTSSLRSVYDFSKRSWHLQSSVPSRDSWGEFVKARAFRDNLRSAVPRSALFPALPSLCNRCRRPCSLVHPWFPLESKLPPPSIYFRLKQRILVQTIPLNINLTGVQRNSCRPFTYKTPLSLSCPVAWVKSSRSSRLTESSMGQRLLSSTSYSFWMFPLLFPSLFLMSQFHYKAKKPLWYCLK